MREGLKKPQRLKQELPREKTVTAPEGYFYTVKHGNGATLVGHGETRANIEFLGVLKKQTVVPKHPGAPLKPARLEVVADTLRNMPTMREQMKTAFLLGVQNRKIKK